MLIELEEFKNHLDLDSNDYDDILTVYINAAGDFIEEYLGRAVENKEFVERFDGDDLKNTIFLNNYPVTKFNWLKYRKGTYAVEDMTDFDDENYQRDDEAGIIYIDTTYPGVRNIEIYYEAGYEAEDIPNTIKVACMKIVSKIYNKRRSDGYSSEEMANARVDWDKFLSSDIEDLLAPYKKHRI